MTTKANYQEFKTLPAWTRAVWSGEDKNGDRKVVNEADPFKWSGRDDPPAIGDKVRAYMNDLGHGTVIGYFVEYGWFGVLVQLEKNPLWRRKQCGGKNPPAHLFGIDLEPRSKAS